mmetsp:Transcript_6567/g.10030  ORF Transcript_6567/g.10030 Transcript_6567/m.10030 type:complete len:382 (-) Transcript_6567:260-1405(-)
MRYLTVSTLLPFVVSGLTSISLPCLPRANGHHDIFRRTTTVLQSSTLTTEEDPNPVASVKALDEIVPRSAILELSKSKSNVRGFLQFLFHASTFGLAATIPSPPISLLATAFVSSFYFQGLHEMVHRTAFRWKAANHVFAHFFGFLCLRPATHYFYYHWQHHKFTGNPKLDSELQPGLLDFPIDNFIGYALYLSGIPFWIDAVSTTVKHAFGICPEEYLKRDQARRQVNTEARIYLLLYGIVASIAIMAKETVGQHLLRLWVVPGILGQPFLRFYLLAEHRGRKKSPLIYENTRSMKTNWLYRNLAWNMPYHMEHHAWPTVPFYRLSDAHTLLVQGINEAKQKGETKYSEFMENKGYISFNIAFLRKLLRPRTALAAEGTF